MKNAYLYYLLFVLTTIVCYGQNENNHWVLGTSDINFGSNPSVVNTVSNSGNYGNASVSDAGGNLLFYTDGVKVWNKNHQIMQNGGAIATISGAALQMAVIVPYPNNINKFIIVSSHGSTTLGSTIMSYTYSIVDFTNNSLGELIPLQNDFSSFNQYSRYLTNGMANFITGSTSYRPLTVAKKNDGSGYWVIIQSNKQLLSYNISSSGFNESPVVSDFSSQPIKGTYIAYSMFRFNENFTKLFAFEFSGNESDPANIRQLFYKLDFNSLTGVFGNFNQISLNNAGGRLVSFELSPNADLAFFVRKPTINGPWSTVPNGEVIVLDLNNTSNVRRLYEFNNSTNFPNQFEFLQNDKHGNMIVSSMSSLYNRNNYFHKVENPNSYANASVKLDWLYLNGNTINKLPQLISSLQPCYTNLTISTNITSGIDKKQASATITASNVISSGAGAIYHAGNSVTLTNGFNAVSGSTFRAYIEGCSNNYVGRISDKEEIKEELVNDEIKLYPNPNNGIFTIDLGNEGETAVSVYDTFGKQVYHSSEKTSSFTINLTNLSTGLYIVQLQGKEFNKTIKFIKK